MIGVFTKKESNRLQFVLDFCFKDKGEDYEFISSEEKWLNFKGPKFNYSKKLLDCDFSVDPSGLLFQTDIEHELQLEFNQRKLALLGDTDPLGVIFYILSRYEEYQSHQKDIHSRFSADQSAQEKLGVLQDPICDQIVKKLWHKLGLDYNSVEEKFECVPSFDIDIAWAYKHRPLWRTLGAFIRGRLTERIAVLIGGKKDPYDNYSKIVEISSRLERIICFAPVSDYGKLDKNISHLNENYRSLLRGLNSNGGMGLHPGYNSFLKTDVIEEEKERIEAILGHDMKKSRFHFLRFDLPKSYQLMVDLGFKKDYSMGYADNVGFRAGTSFPFHFFDLEKNKQEDYLIFPFAYLDNTFKDYLQYDPEEANVKVEEMIGKVKDVGGVFMCVWHNHSISDKREWKGWYQVLEKTIEWGRKA